MDFLLHKQITNIISTRLEKFCWALQRATLQIFLSNYDCLQGVKELLPGLAIPFLFNDFRHSVN